MLISVNGISQSNTLSGIITESKNLPAIGASVILLNKQDSSFIKGTTTKSDGSFELESVVSETFILKITYLGFADYFKAITINSNLNLGVIGLKTSLTKLKEVEVSTNAAMATQNGDTTSFNSAAFKTNKDATAEDLITKMPGVTVQDGKVQAQGEDVKQVLVDGKQFFGDDANAVLKNIPAEIIDKVQVFDRKSDQSQFTGFDDGNTSKTINIVTKAQFRNGIFGKVYGGYGYSDKYKGGGVFNRFKDKQRFSLLVLSNNINEQNFSSEDLLGVTASGGGSRGGGSFGGNRGGVNKGSGGNGGQQSSSDNFLVDIKNGITTTNAIGMNYSDKWGSKTTVSGSYFFNSTQNNAVTNLLRQYIIGSSNGLNYLENNNGSNNNSNHRLNLRFECKLDSQNSLIIQPKISVQHNIGKSSLTGENKSADFVASNTLNDFKSNLSAYNFALPIQFRHSFAKRGRTVSFDINPSYNGSGGNNSLKILNNYYSDSLYSDTVDQQSQLIKSGLNSLGGLVYTEPLSKTSFLSLNYNGSYNLSESEKRTFNYNSQNNEYSMIDTTLSNIFASYYQSHAAGASYRYQKEKANFSIGAAYQYAELNKHQKFPGQYNTTRTFESVLPNAQYQYRYSRDRNFRINYRTNTTAPSIDQLQDVLNNSNSLQLSIGNSDLKQSYHHNLNFRYSLVNTSKSTSLFILLNGGYTDNYISSSTLVAAKDMLVYNDVFLAQGSQITRPVNLSNYYNIRSFINYSFAIKKIKSNLNINAGTSYNNVPALINDKINYSNTTMASLGLALSSNISTKFDFLISATPSYNYVSNTLQTSSNSTYYNQISKAKITVTPLKWLVFQVEYSNQYYDGLTGGYNQNISLLNGAIGFKFLKDQKAELRLFVFDILEQNNSIQRTTTQNYIEDTQTNILQRYFMLTFTYNFKKFFEKKDPK